MYREEEKGLPKRTGPTVVVAEVLDDTDGIDLHDVCHDITAVVPDAACHNMLDYPSIAQSCAIRNGLNGCLGKVFEQTDRAMFQLEVRCRGEQRF